MRIFCSRILGAERPRALAGPRFTLAGVRVFNAVLIAVGVVVGVETIVYALAALFYDAAPVIDDVGFVVALAVGAVAGIVYGTRRQTI